MKNFAVAAALAFGATAAFAQNEVVLGDMTGDGELTIGDITALTEAVLHPDRKPVTAKMCDPDASVPAAIAGDWRAVDGAVLTLSAEGKATVSGAESVTDFEYYPFRGIVVLLDAGGYAVTDYTVIRKTADFLVLRDIQGAYHTYYPSERYATGLALSTTSLTLRTGEMQQLTVNAVPEGSIAGTLVWTSSNPAVASVDQTGLVTALKGGTTTITVTTPTGQSLSAQCSVDVVQLVTEIRLNETALTLDIDGVARLTATVLPASAGEKSVTWSSSDDDVAEVSSKGVVTVNGYGKCVITATATDGSGVKGTCLVTVRKSPEYVDLGLASGTLWATWNVGANAPEEYGDYFAWGEVEPKEAYNKDWSNYFDSNNGTNFNQYYLGTVNGKVGLAELANEDDAAYMNWGEDWRMPTKAQVMELSNECTWSWDSAKRGYTVTGPNMNSLFLPAAGEAFQSSCLYAGSIGFYWSSSLNEAGNAVACYLSFSSTYGGGWSYGYRCNGHSVRAVRAQATVPDTPVDPVVLVESISLSKSNISLYIEDDCTLSATVLPSNADDKSITWSTSDKSVATVTADGYVYAVGEGTCYIVATANDASGVQGYCTVVVQRDPHEYVDLGLPSGTLWAKCNVGANRPEDYGSLFAWGEVTPKTTYSDATYKWMKSGYSNWEGYNKYTVPDGKTSACWYYNSTFVGDNKTELDLEDDAAYVNWGSRWCMPTAQQFSELLDKNYTTITWGTHNGVNGRSIVSKVNGNSIFLPAAGGSGTGLYVTTKGGNYWSRTLSSLSSATAAYLRFSQLNMNMDSATRAYLESVRPVRRTK